MKARRHLVGRHHRPKARTWRTLSPKGRGGRSGNAAEHLDRLASELVREGWTALPRNSDTEPLLQVFDPDVPAFGESITVVPGATRGTWWFRSSTGEYLAPHTQPGLAADKVTRILIPYVTAALAARTRKAPESKPPNPGAPTNASPSAARDATSTQEGQPDSPLWWSAHTRQWWGVVPGGTLWQLVSAPNQNDLAQAIAKARPNK